MASLQTEDPCFTLIEKEYVSMPDSPRYHGHLSSIFPSITLEIVFLKIPSLATLLVLKRILGKFNKLAIHPLAFF